MTGIVTLLENSTKIRNNAIANIRIYEITNVLNMNMEELEQNVERASKLLTAMANPKRLLILCNLVNQELSVGELAERVNLGQSPLSQHLSKLRAWGLVKTRRDAQQVRYSLASDEVHQILTTLYNIYCAR